jgi:hypothetical protein
LQCLAFYLQLPAKGKKNNTKKYNSLPAKGKKKNKIKKYNSLAATGKQNQG